VDTKVDVLRWYTVPGTRDSVVDWLKAQHPGGFPVGEYQTMGGPGPADSYPRILSVAADTASHQPPGDTQVTVLKDGDHTDVRVSVEVIWTPPKPVVELIPDATTTGVLQYHRDRTFGGLPAVDRRIQLSATQVDQLRRLLNPMQPVAPGESSCPAPPDEATLTFNYGGHMVVFTADLGGCGFITIKADSTGEPYLRGGYALAGPIRTLAGLPTKPAY
jgi:hypothetical protein